MATGGDMFPLWDRRNKDQQEFVGLTPCEQVLDESIIVLRTNLRITEVLPHLLQLGAINPQHEEEIMHNAPRHIMVDRLIRHLRTCQMWCFHSLVRACALTDQKLLIRELGLSPDDYIKEGEEAQFLDASDESSNQPKLTKHKVEHPTSPVGQQITHRAQLKRAITDHNQGIKQTLMRRNLYDFGSSPTAKVLDTTTCHIEVDAQHEEKDGEMKDVAERDIIATFPGEEDPPRIIRIYGQPGVGKTALVQHIGYVKSVEFLKRLGASVPLTEGDLTIMVYIAARSIKSTVEQAIYDNLRCRPEDKDILFNHIQAGNGTVVGLDAIDEIRDLKVMENVKRYVSNRQNCGQGPCIIVTARTDLCPINTQAFDRFLVAKGFTESQGVEYVKAYLTGETCTKVLEYIRIHREKLYPIITNPLRCHIFCALVSEGELELDKDDDFCIQKMFKKLEKCLLKREGKEVTAEESKRFYTMCMHGLMHGFREFSQDVLDKFDIVEPFLVFLTKKQTTSLEVAQVSYSFPHEMMYEFFAGQYIESLTFENKKSLLLSICSNPAFRNLQRITFEVLMQQEANQEELLQMMLRAILILQHDHQTGVLSTLKNVFQAKSRYNKLVHLKNKVLSPQSIEKILLEQSNKDKNVNQIWETINDAFDNDPGWLKEMKWYQGLGNGVFGHVTECLQVCRPEQRERLSESTIKHLLPYEYTDKKGWHSVTAVGMSRWAKVVIDETHGEVHTHAWCPADATEAIHERSKAEATVQTLAGHWLNLHINKDQSLWGQPALSAFTPDVWRQLVVEATHWRVLSTLCIPRFTLGRSTPLHGLLQVLGEEEDFWCHVNHGTIGMEDLLVHTGQLKAGCWLFRTNIVVPAGVDMAILRKMREEVLGAERECAGKVIRGPNFVTETGGKYVW